MKIYSTYDKKIVDFIPIEKNKVRMYNCGPTVYDYAQIGNWRANIFVDTLKRSLLYLGYEVTQVMNITDVGHLTSDEDYGEDKMEKGAKREKKTVWEVAQYYIDDFLISRDKLNILPPEFMPRATDHIPEQIEMIEKLVDKGYAYVTKQAVYFDVSKFPDYAKYSGQDLNEKQIAVREEVIEDKDKRNPYDFRLWQLDRPEHQMLWDSPWGRGFPGWHIECSAMSVKYLGQPFDIHTGGVDHITVHHPNEIAQAEAAHGVKFVNYWMHNDHLLVDGKKMSKSLGNFYILQDIYKIIEEEIGFNSVNAPMALRYLYLTSSYRNKMDFTKPSLIAAFNALFDIYVFVGDLYARLIDEREDIEIIDYIQEIGKQVNQNKVRKYKNISGKYIEKLVEAIENDLDTPTIIANLNLLLKDDNLADTEKLFTALEYDKVLGLRLLENTQNHIFNFDNYAIDLIDKREVARQKKDYEMSDKLRRELEEYGIEVLDKKEKSIYYRK